MICRIPRRERLRPTLIIQRMRSGPEFLRLPFCIRLAMALSATALDRAIGRIVITESFGCVYAVTFRPMGGMITTSKGCIRASTPRCWNGYIPSIMRYVDSRTAALEFALSRSLSLCPPIARSPKIWRSVS
jgi:hypothetical protein